MAENYTRRTFLRALSALGGAGALAQATQAWGAPKVFRMAYFETYSPLSFLESNSMRGLLVDILEEVLSKRLGLSVEHTGYPWSRAQLLVQQGASDAICTIATPERLGYALAVDEPVVSAPRRVFARRDNRFADQLKNVHTPADLRTLNPISVTYASNGWSKANMADYESEVGTDFDSAMKMLVGKRGDIMVDNSLTMEYSFKRIKGGDMIQMFPIDMGSAHFQLLVSKLSPHVALLPQIDKALRQFKKEPGYGAIFERYGVKP